MTLEQLKIKFNFFSQLPPQLFFGLASNFILSIFSAVTNAYVNVIFLSTYSISQLPYLYIGAGILTAVMLILTPTEKPDSITYLQIVSAIIIIIFIYILQMNIKYVPLIFSILLLSISTVNSNASLNAINRSFDVREYKRYGTWINTAGTCGNILGGVLISVLVTIYSATIVEYFIGALLLITIPFCHPPKKQQFIRKSDSEEVNHSSKKYTLFYTVMTYFLISSIVFTFTDYNFKIELQENFSKREIGQFFGTFYAICCAITLLLQLFATNKVLKYFGVVSLLTIFPVYGILASAGVIASPSLFTVTLLYGGITIAYSSYVPLAREVLLNILPMQIRSSKIYQTKALIKPLGILLGGVIIGFIIKYANLRIISVLTILASIYMFYFIKRIKQKYVSELQKSVKSKRFGIMLQYSKVGDTDTLRKIVLNALADDDPEINRLGLSLLRKLKFNKLPKNVVTLLNSPYPDIRIEAIEVVKLFRDVNALPYLKLQLRREFEPEVIWGLMDTIALLQPHLAEALARDYLTKIIPEARAGAIRVLLATQSSDAYSQAIKELKKMIMSDDPKMRENAARVIGAAKLNNLMGELKQLLVDPNDEVSINAVHSAVELNDPSSIATLVSLLGKRDISYHAMQALVHFNEQSIPDLLKNIEKEDLIVKLATVRTLAAIPSIKAEQYFATIFAHNNIVIVNTLAKHLVFRKLRLKVTKKFDKQIRLFASEEMQRIYIYNYLQTKDIPTFFRSEIESRLKLAQKRYLYWFAISTNPIKVLQLMPDILAEGNLKAKALELLDTYTKDRVLAQSLSHVFEKSIFLLEIKEEAIQEHLDEWLKKLYKIQSISAIGGDMLLMQKVFVLRSVTLFKDLPAESLLAIAKEVKEHEVSDGDEIFAQGDPATGLYIIVSGTVEIERDGRLLSTLSNHDFFGELALIDHAPRFATAIAKSDGLLLFMDKITFDRITDDLPEVLKSVTHAIVGYLRSNIENLNG